MNPTSTPSQEAISSTPSNGACVRVLRRSGLEPFCGGGILVCLIALAVMAASPCAPDRLPLDLGLRRGRACSAKVLAPGQVLEISSGSTGTAPADGRLRGPDFAAVVTRVAWPQSVPSSSGSSDVAGAGRRLVAFALSVSQTSADSGLGNSPTALIAKLTVGATSLVVPMSAIDQQIASGSSGSAQTTGTDSFVASVPARAHDVASQPQRGRF